MSKTFKLEDIKIGAFLEVEHYCHKCQQHRENEPLHKIEVVWVGEDVWVEKLTCLKCNKQVEVFGGYLREVV